jgi:hypothetical protein
MRQEHGQAARFTPGRLTASADDPIGPGTRIGDHAGRRGLGRGRRNSVAYHPSGGAVREAPAQTHAYERSRDFHPQAPPNVPAQGVRRTWPPDGDRPMGRPPEGPQPREPALGRSVPTLLILDTSPGRSHSPRPAAALPCRRLWHSPVEAADAALRRPRRRIARPAGSIVRPVGVGAYRYARGPVGHSPPSRVAATREINGIQTSRPSTDEPIFRQAGINQAPRQKLCTSSRAFPSALQCRMTAGSLFAFVRTR